MAYQLVLQFHGDSLRIFRELASVEELMKSKFDESEKFDGLDAGAHGANIFIYTDSPKQTFERVRPLLNEAESAAGFTAAYRTVAREQFHILWPPDSPIAFNLR